MSMRHKSYRRPAKGRPFAILWLIIILIVLSGCASQPDKPPTPVTEPAIGMLAIEHGETGHTNPMASLADTPTSTPAGIRLGSGDVIRMRMFGQPDMDTQGFVSSDGKVSLPLLDAFDIGGLTPAEAQNRIAAAYTRGDYFHDPQVSITLVEHRSQEVAVLGEVRRPGRFTLDTRTSLLDALAEAGGIDTQGARQIVVIRPGIRDERHFRVDIDALVGGHGQRPGFQLQAGDTVFVPKAPIFYIYGQVRRPDAYAIQPGMTVMQAISTGGGLTDRGSNSRIEIHRRVDDHDRTLAARLDQPIQPGDTIFVKERYF
ncbi:SLBB domain-containing protein [Salinisphaera sp. SPP-AMP-43]|uniref:SLBB domain-containing protein n=1 Tax=Salinisphaera sp. SPP-AMP-43 TaxID=3121288 RepID=UPI003C6E5761